MAARRDIAAAVAEERAARTQLEGPAEAAPPEVESLGAGVGYVVRFPMARITVDGLGRGRDGLRGDVRVEAGPFGDGNYRVLTEGRIELSSISQRETWEKRLFKRWAGVEWGAILDRFAAAILQAEKRLDKPPILLRDAARPPASGMLLDPFLLAGMPTIWYGDGGTLKSLLGLAAVTSLQTGVALIGHAEPKEQRRVLYCNFEPFEEWEHRERMRKLLHLRDEDPSDAMPEVVYLDCVGGTIVNQVERIRMAVKRHCSDYLVVDSISCAAEGPLSDDETARLYYRILGYIGLPSLSTGHTAKNGNPDSPFGSVMWKNLARLGWFFQRAEESDGPDVALKLTSKKWSTVAKPADVGLMVRFGAGIDVEVASSREMVGQQEEHWRRIQSRLRVENVPMTYEELALALGLSPEQVKARVNEHPLEFVKLAPVEGSRKARVALRARGV